MKNKHIESIKKRIKSYLGEDEVDAKDIARKYMSDKQFDDFISNLSFTDRDKSRNIIDKYNFSNDQLDVILDFLKDDIKLLYDKEDFRNAISFEGSISNLIAQPEITIDQLQELAVIINSQFKKNRDFYGHITDTVFIKKFLKEYLPKEDVGTNLTDLIFTVDHPLDYEDWVQKIYDKYEDPNEGEDLVMEKYTARVMKNASALGIELLSEIDFQGEALSASYEIKVPNLKSLETFKNKMGLGDSDVFES